MYAKLRTAIFERCFLHEQKPKMIEVAGKAITVDPSQWTERCTSTVSMHLGYGKKDDMPQELKGLYKGLTHDPALQNMFTPLLTNTAKIAGITGISRYLAPNFQPPQPNLMEMMQAQSDKTESDAAMLTAQRNAGKNERLAAYEQGKLQLEGLDRHLGAMEKNRDLKRLDLETAARVDVAHRQMLLEDRMCSEEAKAQATISPEWTCKLLSTSVDPAALMPLGSPRLLNSSTAVSLLTTPSILCRLRLLG
jgi:hypothetical protein